MTDRPSSSTDASPEDRAGEDRAGEDQRSILSSSAVMAAGTIVSRISGYARTLLLAAALGNLLHADVFNIANTIPNMLYILLAGGVFNAVLVPQLVRAAKDDADRGEAYTNRVVTLAALFLGAVTLLLVLAAPWVMDLYVSSSVPDDARESIVDLARWCLPQVFFYGMFVLVGQILNARGRFGPMMWAPIANNVISVLVLAVYLLLYGTAKGAELTAGFDADQELVLGLGSTLGIAAQLAILVPYLRKAGFSFRPRFDFRGTGLGHTLRLGVWTVLFVIVNQVAYTVVVRLASDGTASGAEDSTGYSVYAAAFLIVMVPHSVITVSLATAILPTLSRRAAETDHAGLARTLSSTLRTALAVVLPFAALLPVVAPELARVISLGAAAATYENYIGTLAAFGPGLVLFTVHYLMLRGFYALEQTRTVFLVQCGVGVTNVVAALLLVRATDDAGTAPALATAYAAAYLVGAVLSYTVLRRHLGGLRTPTLVRFVVRMAIAVGVSTAAAWGSAQLLDVLGDTSSYAVAALRAAVVTLVDVAVFLAAARVLRLTEVTSVVETLTRRLPLPRTR